MTTRNAQRPARKAVFLVGCDESAGEAIAACFADQAVSLLSFPDAEHAFDALDSSFPHLIVSEMELPGMDGSEFCGRIRGGEDTIDVPFVIYTSEARQQQHLRALKAGADDYIPKTSEAEEVSLRIHRLIERVESLRRLSIIDSLTMLANRRYFDRRLVEECEKFRRYNRPLSLLLFDVDEFKFINDTYGHIAGDKALKSIADVLLNGLRTGDVVCRYGGDEFAVLMPETSLEGAWHASERLRLNVERLRIHAAPQDNTVRAAANIKLSISGGVSTFIDESQRDSMNLLNFADQALLNSKAKGGNTITKYEAAG